MIDDSKANLPTSATSPPVRFCPPILVAAALLLYGVPVRAEQFKPRATGELIYKIYCLNCHGQSGRGDGPMARILKVKPANLRLISSRNGGTFPSEEVYRTIDGRETVTGHGSREMPLWGLAFQQTDMDANQEEDVRARIEALIEHLKSLQEPAKGKARRRSRGYRVGRN